MGAPPRANTQKIDDRESREGMPFLQGPLPFPSF